MKTKHVNKNKSHSYFENKKVKWKTNHYPGLFEESFKVRF